MEQVELRMMGVLDMNILPYLERQIPKRNYDNLIALLNEYKIGHNDITQMIIQENDNEVVYSLQIKNYDEDLILRIKKGAL